jgi:GrpB-like predicted nucleotidyltransferase (UPF0157 family)
VGKRADHDVALAPVPPDRFCSFLSRDLYDVNLHVFPATSAAPEIERMLGFRDWLRTHDEDRAYYERTKRRLASNNWKYLHHYANAKKSDVIEEILTRAVRRRAARP